MEWVVEYGVWSEREQKLKRKRVVLVGSTLAERLADDRDSTAEENKTSFILTNIVHQAPQLNRQSWLRREIK